MRRLAIALAAVLLTVAPAAQSQDTAKAKVVLKGAGATFPAPLYEKWIQAYRQVDPRVSISYDAVGSGEGQRRFGAGSVDFGASDAALSDEQMARVQAGARLIPASAGIVVLAYNVPGLDGPLKLSRDVYVDIFARRIRTWNDPRIRAVNPGLTLPNRSIALVARQDGSGTTFALTNHLAAISEAWRDRGPGVGNLVDWRGAAMLARGNEGVAGRIRGQPGLDRLRRVPLRQAPRPADGPASEQGRALCGAGRAGRPDRAGAERVPDAGESPGFPPRSRRRGRVPDRHLYVAPLVRSLRGPGQGGGVEKVRHVGLTEGQAHSHDLGYIPLPPEVATLSLAAVERIN
jgi:phosphate transport system substrate-binding protein